MTTSKTEVNNYWNQGIRRNNLYKSKYTANLFLQILPATNGLIQLLKPYQVCGTTCLSIKQDVNGKSRWTQEAHFIMGIDIIFIQTDQQQTRKTLEPIELQMCVKKNTFSTSYSQLIAFLITQ